MKIRDAIRAIDALTVVFINYEDPRGKNDYADALFMAGAALRAKEDALAHDEQMKATPQEDKPSYGWISVKDRLPDKDGSYIVHSGRSGTVFAAHFWARDNRWSGRGLNLNITHWMPLPDPPKEMHHEN